MQQVGSDGKLLSPSPSPKESPNHIIPTTTTLVGGQETSVFGGEGEKEGGESKDGDRIALMKRIQTSMQGKPASHKAEFVDGHYLRSMCKYVPRTFK